MGSPVVLGEYPNSFLDRVKSLRATQTTTLIDNAGVESESVKENPQFEVEAGLSTAPSVQVLAAGAGGGGSPTVEPEVPTVGATVTVTSVPSKSMPPNPTSGMSGGDATNEVALGMALYISQLEDLDNSLREEFGVEDMDYIQRPSEYVKVIKTLVIANNADLRESKLCQASSAEDVLAEPVLAEFHLLADFHLLCQL